MCLFLVQWPEKELALHVYFTYQAPNGEKIPMLFWVCFFFCPAAYRERGEEKKQTTQSSEECRLSAMLWNNSEVKCESLQYVF